MKRYIALIALLPLIFSAPSAQAWGLADITRPLSRGLSRLDPTNPGSATSPIRKYKFVISNPTRTRIPYTLNGRLHSIRPQGKVTWTIKNTSNTVPIKFKNGHGQTITYDLGSGTYNFRWTDGVLNLYRN